MNNKNLHLIIIAFCLAIALVLTAVALFPDKDSNEETITQEVEVSTNTKQNTEDTMEDNVPTKVPTAIEIDDGEVHYTDTQLERLENLDSLTISDNNVVAIPELVGYAEQDYGIDSATEYMSYFSEFPIEVYCAECVSLGGDRIRLLYQIKNTDVVTSVEFDNVFNPGETNFLDVCNIYGSDYCWVFWNNGVPANSMDYYEMIFNAQVPWGQYETDYVPGESELVLRNVKGEVFTVEVNFNGN